MQITIHLTFEEMKALRHLATAQRRRPREVVEVVLRRYLARKGLLDDPTRRGRTAGASTTHSTGGDNHERIELSTPAAS